MELETLRLRLRSFNLADQTEFNALIRDKMASPMAAYDHAFPVDDAGLSKVLAFFAATEAFIAVEHRETRRLIGFVTLHPAQEAARDIGYCFHTEWQGQGFATEAVSAAVEYARDVLHAQKLVCGTAKCNVASVRLLERLGFTLVSEELTSFSVDERGEMVKPFIACKFERRL